MMTAEEYYKMKRLESGYNELIMENGMLRNKVKELKAAVDDLERALNGAGVQTVMVPTETKREYSLFVTVKDFDGEALRVKVDIPSGEVRVIKNGDTFPSITDLTDSGYTVPDDAVSSIAAAIKCWNRGSNR